MVTLEQLKQTRKKEAEGYKKISKRLAVKREKRKVQADIRKIRAAKRRGQFGFDSESMERTDRIMKGTGKVLKGIAKGTGKFMLGVGEAMDKEMKRKKPRGGMY